MTETFALTPRYPHLLHGADYNPDQWLDRPDILEKDIQLMRKAGINCVSLGIFSWAKLEPAEGEYHFEWMDRIIETLYENGIYTVLATPSGAKPAWMAQKYPEIRRVDRHGMREHQGGRHNHCYTSPIYREKVCQIDTLLAQRYASHPAVILWHLSNEFGGECYCDLCVEAFRNWLAERYGTLDALNHAWWADFWSHTYTDWSQIEPPYVNGETNVHGLNLDWKRFVSDRTRDFVRMERDCVKAVNPDIPVTINMMEDFYYGLNYFDFRDVVDVVSWDSYPHWHEGADEILPAHQTAIIHDLMRSLKDQPFLLMENTPSTTNWAAVSRVRKPRMLMLSSVQALAHGSDSVQYFQWRASRGSCEKFHSAVVGHDGTDASRTFQEVSQVGKMLQDADMLYPTQIRAQACVLFDWENMWAIDNSKGPRNAGMYYRDTVREHHRALWWQGIACDIKDSVTFEPDRYKLVIAPMLYMLRGGIEDKLRKFVEGGGTLVTTYFSAVVNETDLCFEGTVPHALCDVMGIVQDEIDALYDGMSNGIRVTDSDGLALRQSYRSTQLCALIHTTTAKTIGVYETDFYAGSPAFTVNHYGAGQAYFLATRPQEDFYTDFYTAIAEKLGLERALHAPLPDGVVAGKRCGENGDQFLFLQNYTYEAQEIPLDGGYIDLITEQPYSDRISLPPLGSAILRPASSANR